MREQRWPWLLTAGLMLVAAAATGRSTYLYWLPCRGSMLKGSIVNYYVDVGRKFSPACKRAMDGDIALVVPWTSGLNLVAMAVLGVAWLTLVVGLRWRWRTRAVAALPGLATLAVAMAGAAAIGDPKPLEYTPPLMGLVMFLELLAVVALVWILVWQPEARGRHIGPRLVVVLSGTTAFGFVHVSSEYFTMLRFAGGDGDMPIGYGYLIFATITLSAILTVIMTLLVRQKVADAEPHQDHGSRPYDAADVSRSPVAGGARVPSMPKQLIVGALVQVVSISLGVGLGYLAFLSVFSILDR
ncbi:MAG TPA: hypothetical protein VIQ76_14165 [Propionibacteriaceae bacterium]